MKKYFFLVVVILTIAAGCGTGNQGSSSASVTGYILELGKNAPI